MPRKRISKGIKSEELKERWRQIKLGEKNPLWKGDDVSYRSLHEWVNNHKEKTDCAICGAGKNIDLANISQEYKRDLDDWEWLCRRCHMKKDGRFEKMNIERRARNKDKVEEIICLFCKQTKIKRKSGRHVFCNIICYNKAKKGHKRWSKYRDILRQEEKSNAVTEKMPPL